MNNRVLTLRITVEETANIIALMIASDSCFGTDHAKLITKIMSQLRGE